MKILLLDNYDSFTYNLSHMVEEITGEYPDVIRNDEITLDEIAKYDLLILSPGPGVPSESGILLECIKRYAGRKPIFGVCLGLQAIVEAFGGELMNLNEVYHGLSTSVNILTDENVIFQGLPDQIDAGRYHSWIASKENFPEDLEITAEDEQGKIMAIKHIGFPISAVQFHPESILTPFGKKIIKNFIERYKK